MRLNFYVSFDNVFDIIDPLLADDSTRAPTPPDGNVRTVWSFDHLTNMKLYPGRNLNHSLNAFGIFPEEFIDASFIKDETKTEINYVLRLLSSNVNFNQLSMRATFNNCPAGTRFFLIKPNDMTSVYNYYTDVYNSTIENADAFARKSRLFGPEIYTPADIVEAIDGAYNRAEHYFTNCGPTTLGHFTSSTYKTNEISEVSDLTCRLLIKE